MQTQKTNRLPDLLPLTLLAVILLQVVLLCCFWTNGIEFDNEPAAAVNDGWTYIDPSGTRHSITLPAQVDTPVGMPTVLETVLPRIASHQSTICLRASMQTVRAYLDDTLIYEFGAGAQPLVKVQAGSAWALFRLPDDAAGKTLRLELSSPYESFSGKISSIWLSSKTSILFAIFQEYGIGFATALMLWFIGIALLIMYFCMRFSALHKPALFYLALFSLMVGLWVFGESKTIQFFIGNEYVVAKLSFLALLTMPLPFTLYLDNAYPRHTIGYPRIFFWIFTANFVVCTALELTGVLGFFQTLISVQLLLLCLILVTITALLVESFRYHNTDARIQLNGLCILGLSGIVEIAISWLSAYRITSKLFSIGMLVYFVYVGVSMLKRFLTLARDRREAEFFERLAFTDAVTSGSNRMAFERDAEIAFRKDGDRNNWLVLFDLDNLKVINDTIGHQTGDEAIRLAYQCITEAFAAVGTSYRIGGDEYAAIAHGVSEEVVDKCLTKLYALMAEQQKHLSYEFSTSYGKGCFDPETEEFRTFFVTVDKRMYANKDTRHHRA